MLSPAEIPAGSFSTSASRSAKALWRPSSTGLENGLSTRKHWHGWEGEIEMRRHRPRRPTPQLRPKVTRVGQSAAADRPPTMRDRNTGNFTDGQNSD
jgi:hypothetical protein